MEMMFWYLVNSFSWDPWVIQNSQFICTEEKRAKIKIISHYYSPEKKLKGCGFIFLGIGNRLINELNSFTPQYEISYLSFPKDNAFVLQTFY